MSHYTFKAGAAQVDITPPLGTVINGEFTSRYANKIADPLFAKALVLQDGTTTLLIIMVDICAMQRDFLDDIKATIARSLGVPPECQLIAATHTHSGGSVTDLLMGHVDWAYRQWLPQRIVETATDAYANLRPAKIGWGSVDQPQHLLCRRYQMGAGYEAINPVTDGLDKVKTNPFGDEEQIVGSTTTPDPGLRYLAVQGIDGHWISLLANYSLHYVGDCERGTLSADYFGYFARSVASGLGADYRFVGMMSNGTSGEINIWDFQDPDRYPKGNHEKSKMIGDDLASGVVESLPEIHWEEAPVLEANYIDLLVGTRKPTAAELATAERIVSETDYESITFGEPNFFKQVYAREQVLLSGVPDEKLFPIQSFRIGSGAIGGLGGEFFSETGLQLKSVGPTDKYFTVCLANDYVGYVPPGQELEKGGYECWRCRTSYLAADAEEKIRSVLEQQLVV
ncbi:hypothetical protein [Parapedobacter sp. 10938]|uniref:hypothetical protein n=1 Tax=Parapedobacter flavus TaxID=3110225 RepID=UPI002DBFD302|nr:hypothetical protein [Parapedobacter sp. 10938]MEC3878583.1 hypothetical protein [Parapedobacter sp. 10938]